MSPSCFTMAAQPGQPTWRPPTTSSPQLYARSPLGQTAAAPPPVPPEMPNLRGMYDRISELLLDNYALTGNADWIGLRDQATTIFAVPNTSTARKPLPTSPPPRALPTPPTLTPSPVSSPTCSAKEWDIDSTRVLDVSMMLDGNYNATADPEWLEIGSRMRSCYRAASEEARKPLLPPDAEAQWRNNSPIPAHQITPAKCSFSTPVRFPLASVSNVPVAIKGGSLADYGNNNNAWTGDKNDGRDHVMAKNVDPWNVEPSAKVAKFVTV